jgi:cytochrome c
MAWLRFAVLGCAAAALFAQESRYGFGRPASQTEISAWDIAISPDGKELPPGPGGTASEGAAIYAKRCATCHGEAGRGGRSDALAGGKGTLATGRPVKTVGSFWPYATTIWDYINRAMPLNAIGSLSAHEVYAVTAYLLAINGIIGEADVMNSITLSKVRMPNRNGFIRDVRPDWNEPKRSSKNQ